jgi:hypothetical protein
MAGLENVDPPTADEMRKMFTPSQVDEQVRQAIQFCWMMLPEHKRTIDELEKQLRRIVERAVRDFREDAQAFGL